MQSSRWCLIIENPLDQPGSQLLKNFHVLGGEPGLARVR
jgi:hypothetical protein